MTIIQSAVIVFSISMLTSCGASKKSSAPATSSIIPSETELKAIQVKYPETTLATLNEGHSIFIGACTNCHSQYNIYKRSEASWLHEIDDMSPKAKLTPIQKDALTKYILAMKAAAPVQAK